MRHVRLPHLLLASTLIVPSANASNISLLAIGTLSGTSDLSGLSGTLENGLPANILGGLGSGLDYIGNNTFLALPDRGPNAMHYAASVDDTTSYIARFHTISMTLTPNGGSGLPFTVTPTLTQTTLLSSPTPLNYGSGSLLKDDGVTPIGPGAPAQNGPNTFYFTGRSDNFGAGNSLNPNNARLDPESIRASKNGTSVFISDEYGPYVYQFDKTTGQRTNTFQLPANLAVANLSPKGTDEISGLGNTSGRVANKGMEGLALTPDGKTLVGIMQAPLLQDQTANPNLLRIVTIDIATGITKEYGYQLTTGTGVSDIVALSDHEFLVDERDGKGLGDGSNAKVKQVFYINLANATDITNLSQADLKTATMVTKNPFIDLVSLLIANGISAANIPSKIEGLALGPDQLVNGVLEHTLWISNDNDFDPTNSGQNKFFVVGFQDSDVPTTPLPAPIVLFGSGVLGLIGLLRRRV